MNRIVKFHARMRAAAVGMALFAGVESVRADSSRVDAPSAVHPLLSAASLQVVKAFDAKKVSRPSDWRWYYYVPGSARLTDRAVETTKLGFKKEPKGPHVVILFDGSSNAIYWKWILAPAAQWFEQDDAVNVGTICFGLDPLVEDLWIKHNPDWDHRYKISSRLFTGEVFGGDVTRLERMHDWIVDEWVDARSPDFIRLCRTFDQQTNQLAKLRVKIQRAEVEIEALTRKINQDPDDPWTIGYGNRDKLIAHRRQLRAERNGLQSEYDSVYKAAMETERKINKLGDEYRTAQKKEPLEKAVRKMSFTVSVVKQGD